MDRMPPDVREYWQETLDGLARYPACPELDVLPLRSTPFATLYGVRLTSVGPYRLFGYLSVPVGAGPFPAIYYPPKYQSVLEIIPQGTAYMFRGIVADSVRGLEFLLTRRELDPARVVVMGNDLALMTAALIAGATQVVATPALFYKTTELAPRTQAYPLEEINDYLRTFPARAQAV